MRGFRLWGCGGSLSPLGSITTQKPYHNKIINQSIERIYPSFKSLYPNQGLRPSGYEKPQKVATLNLCPRKPNVPNLGHWIFARSLTSATQIVKVRTSWSTFNYHKSIQKIINETHVYSDFVVGTELRPTPRLSKAQTSTPLFPSSAAGNWSSSLGVTVPVSPLICGCHESWVPANPDHHPPKISK